MNSIAIQVILIYNMGWNSLGYFINCLKRKLPQTMFYSYNLDSYWIHSWNETLTSYMPEIPSLTILDVISADIIVFILVKILKSIFFYQKIINGFDKVYRFNFIGLKKGIKSM